MIDIYYRMKIVFCIPGRDFSRQFLLSWTQLIMECTKKGHEILVSQQYSSVVHFARAQCLGGDVLKGADQKPFQGQVEYDFMMWIDSDMVFTPDDFFKLLESPHDVTCGSYSVDLQRLCVVKEWNEEYFKKNGAFEFITPDMVKGAKDLTGERYVEVAYAGMGWMLIKKGAIEDIKYPWFRSDIQTIEASPVIVDLASEDVSFCRALKAANHPVMLDTDVRVGHLKPIVI